MARQNYPFIIFFLDWWLSLYNCLSFTPRFAAWEEVRVPDGQSHGAQPGWACRLSPPGQWQSQGSLKLEKIRNILEMSITYPDPPPTLNGNNDKFLEFSFPFLNEGLNHFWSLYDKWKMTWKRKFPFILYLPYYDGFYPPTDLHRPQIRKELNHFWSFHDEWKMTWKWKFPFILYLPYYDGFYPPTDSPRPCWWWKECPLDVN